MFFMILFRDPSGKRKKQNVVFFFFEDWLTRRDQEATLQLGAGVLKKWLTRLDKETILEMGEG